MQFQKYLDSCGRSLRPRPHVSVSVRKQIFFFPPVWPTVHTYLMKMVTDNASFQKLSQDCGVFGSIWKYRMQCFSWRTCTVRAAGTNVECRMHQPLRGSGGRPPGKFVKLDSLYQSATAPAFPGPKQGNQERLLRR